VAPQSPWRRVSSCDVLDPLGHFLVAFSGRLVHDDRFASNALDSRDATYDRAQGRKGLMRTRGGVFIPNG
jgi:hypothetical protein